MDCDKLGEHVSLQRRPCEAADDWSGITDQKKRKRLQNRLNQRLSRERKRRIANVKGVAGSGSTVACLAQKPKKIDAANITNYLLSFLECTEEDIVWKREILRQFSEQALSSYATGDPRAEHHLRLIQVNTINGLTRNAMALGFSFDWLICEMLSPFGQEGRASTTLQMDTIPATLLPVEGQLKKAHHPWMDLLPLPQLRHNFFNAWNISAPDRAYELEDQLFRDIIESGSYQREWVGLAVWGDPWDPQSWEMSVPFTRKWAWVLHGCPELIVSTNHWRTLRGERPVVMTGFVVGEEY